MGRAVDLIHGACNEIVGDVSLIHDESFMLHIFDDLRSELPEFDAYLKHEFENKKTECVKASSTKAIPLKELIKEIFCPVDEDNRDSTEMLENLAGIGIAGLIAELEDEKKATYKYLSISGTEFSYEHCPDNAKKAIIGKMASNDLAESSFAKVTAQVQCYGRIGMCAAAAVSDCDKNGFLHRSTLVKQIKRKSTSSKKRKKEKKRGLYHNLPKELQITLLMMCVEDAPPTRASNNADLSRSRE